jgi:hypothetical protein
MSRCTTHHHACDCREQKVAVLIKCALDLAPAVDLIKAFANIPASEKARILDIVERTYDAIEQLGIDVATGLATPTIEINLQEGQLYPAEVIRTLLIPPLKEATE